MFVRCRFYKDNSFGKDAPCLCVCACACHVRASSEEKVIILKMYTYTRCSSTECAKNKGKVHIPKYPKWHNLRVTC